MTAFRPMGSVPGVPCPVCSYPHFPFCMRHPPSTPSLPSLMTPSFALQSRPPGRLPIHPLHPPPHSAPLIPSPQPGFQPSSLLGQPFSGRGTISDATPMGVPLMDRACNSVKGGLGQRFGEGSTLSDSMSRLPGHSAFQNSIPHLSNSRSTHPIHLPQSVEHFPVSLNPTPTVPPHSGPSGLTRSPGSGWSEEDERDSLNPLKDKLPSMPQWYLDQQRRSSGKGSTPNGRSGIGEMLRGEEIVSAHYFNLDSPMSRAVKPVRLERDRLFDEDVQEASWPGCWFQEDLPPMLAERDDVAKIGAFHRMDASGNGGLIMQDGIPRADSGMNEGSQPKGGRVGLLDHFEGGREGVSDRERRGWGVPAVNTTRDSCNEQGFSSHHSGYGWTPSLSVEQRQASALPSFARDIGGGGIAHQVVRRDRPEEGRRLQPSISSPREEQLLREHGLLDDGAQGLMIPRSGSFIEGAAELWEGHGAPGGSRFSVEGQDETAQFGLNSQRRVLIDGEHAKSTMGVEAASAYLGRQQIRPGHTNVPQGAGSFVPPERPQASGERPFIERSESGSEQNFTHGCQESSASNGGPPQRSGPNNDSSFTPPAQEELDELYYLKHFPQSDDPEGRDGHSVPHTTGTPPLRAHIPPIRLRARGGRLLQESSSHVGSQNWTSEHRSAGVQNTVQVLHSDGNHHQGLPQVNSQGSVQFPSPDHLQKAHPSQQNSQGHRGHLQQPIVSHQCGRSSPQAHGQHQLHHGPQGHFQQHAQQASQSHPQHQPSPLYAHNQQPDQNQPSQLSNGNRMPLPTQSTQLQLQQHQHLHHALPLQKTQSSLMTNQLSQPLAQSQGPLFHQMQQQGHVGQSHLPRFYVNTTGLFQPVGVEGGIGSGRTAETHSGTSQVPLPPSSAHHHPLSASESSVQAYAPPLPLNAATAPPPPPPSPPYCHPPPHSPPAPPPPPSPPRGHSSGLVHVPVMGLQATLSVQPLDLEEHSHGLNYPHPPHVLKQPLLVVPSRGPGFQPMGPPYMHQTQFSEFRNHGQLFPQQISQQLEKSKFVDAASIFRRPGRLTRPERIVVILRGLPGSGKSYLAKALRDVEVMNGGSAPRIHSMDDYFMTEVEKVEGEEGGITPSSSMRSKKRVIKKVMEYCFEPEMEEVYRASMLKAFRKTLEEGMFSFVIVDDRNVLVADFAQFWAIAKRSGYEVYLLEPPYRDPTGCAARNVHNFTREQIQDMEKRWEPAPPLYLQLEVSSLFRGDDLNAQDITEVEMDADDMERETDEQEEGFQPMGDGISSLEYSNENGNKAATTGDRWEESDEDDGEEDRVKPVKRMRVSEEQKNSSDSSGGSHGQGAVNDALSGLMQAYGKREKYVHWADDQGEKDDDKGFLIGSALKKISDLVIGPGPGYNKGSNPVQKEERGPHLESEHLDQSTKFLEQYRAEQDAFKAVFAIRRQRLTGLDEEE